MIEELQIRAQKRIEQNQATNQKKIEEKLAMMIALDQKSAKLQQQTKIQELLAATASEQNASQKLQQTALLDGIKRLTPAKHDYSNLNCGKMGHGAKVCRQPTKPTPPAGQRLFPLPPTRPFQDKLPDECVKINRRNGVKKLTTLRREAYRE